MPSGRFGVWVDPSIGADGTGTDLLVVPPVSVTADGFSWDRDLLTRGLWSAVSCVSGPPQFPEKVSVCSLFRPSFLG